MTSTSIEACLFKHPFYRGSHSKGIKERALHVHQRKTKHFIAKLFAQPYMLLNTFSILVIGEYIDIMAGTSQGVELHQGGYKRCPIQAREARSAGQTVYEVKVKYNT